jgi:hypothetical protein
MYKASIGPTHIQSISMRRGYVIIANSRLMNSHVNVIWNSSTNGAIRVAANSLYESVLYFQNVTCSHGIRVDKTSLTSIQEQKAFHASIFMKLRDIQQHYVVVCCSELRSKRTKMGRQAKICYRSLKILCVCVPK